MAIKPPRLTSYQKEILFSPARFTITEASTKAGKTYSHIMWLFGMSHKLEYAENHNYWWVAPVYSQSKIAFKRLRRYLANVGAYRFNESDLIIYCPNKAEIHFKTADKPDNLYGEDVYACVFDEAPRAKPEAWYALRSTLSSTEAPCKLIGNFGGVSNWVHILKEKAKTDPKYAYFKVNAWDAVREGILSKEEVEQAEKDLPPKIFKALYLAEASEDEGQLISNESISKLFSNTHIEGGIKYITADIARMGKDLTVIYVWDGLRKIETIKMATSLVNESVDAIRALQIKHNVNNSRIVVDSDGVGGGVQDYLNCRGFVNGGTAIKVKNRPVNFANLKSQCYYKLAEMINRNEIYVSAELDEKSMLIAELEMVRLAKDIDVSKIAILGKDKVKEVLGRSPDYSDALMMRMLFELEPTKEIYRMVF